MGRKCDPKLVKKEDLVTLLEQHGRNLEELEELGKNELVWMARDACLITDEQAVASFVRNHVTIPCYLYTHIEDSVIRERLEQYVQAYSTLFSRGSYLANLICLNIPVPTFELVSFPSQLMPIPSFLKKSTEVKKCFFPERWLERASNTEDIDPLIRKTFLDNKTIFDAFLSCKPNTVMANTGWDNPLNHMGDSYLGNVHTMIITPLKGRIWKFLEKRDYKRGTLNKEVQKMVFFSIRPSNMLHNDDFEWLVGFRDFLGLKDIAMCYWDGKETKLDELNDLTWTLHLWLQQVFNEDNTSRLPVATLGRTYSYLDAKTVKTLLPAAVKKKMLATTGEHEGTELQKLLGLTCKMFNKRRSKIRKRLRMKHKGKKFHKKWRKQGYSCLPKRCKISFVSTDGVGLRLGLEVLPHRIMKNCECKELPPVDCLKIGEDDGRVNLMVTSDNRGNVRMIKRKHFYECQRHKKLQKWERERMSGTAWGASLAALAEAGGFRNARLDIWTRSLNVLTANMSTIRREQVELKDRSIFKMARFRAKKRFLDGSWKKVLKPVFEDKQLHVALGRGDAKFDSTGRGEKAVPTEGVTSSLRRVIGMCQLKERCHVYGIQEDNTSKCCHRCGTEMRIIRKVVNGEVKVDLRYRLCPKCMGAKTAGRRRNRDVNASKNILQLLECQLQGLERPEHLINPWAWKYDRKRRRIS